MTNMTNMMTKTLLFLAWLALTADAAPSCGVAPSPFPAPDALPLFHVLPGVDVSAPALCESNSTNAVVLAALCGQLPGCAGYTVGSGGGEPGDLPPHDCRGSRLYSHSAVTTAQTPHAGVDLFVRGPANSSAVNSLTPKPRSLAFPPTRQTVQLEAQGFRVVAAAGGGTSAVLRDAMARYGTLLFVGNQVRDDRASSMATATGGAPVSSMAVRVADAGAELKQGVSEAYNLTVSAAAGGAILLEAETVWGALRGLETMAQIVVQGRDGYFADAQTVRDAPQYAYRGLMIDTARHFLGVDTILRVIEGMAVEKLNLLHWHAVDDQSFPVEVKSLPRLAQRGSFGPGLTYSAENVTRVVAFARSRGVQVMLEVDTPGHCQVLERAYPELGLVTECPGTTCWPPLDVSKPAVLRTVATIFNDLVPMFPNEQVFIGGDECHTTCWANNAGVRAFAKARNLSIGHTTESVGGQGSVFGWWINQVVGVVQALGKTPSMWSPLFWDPESPPSKLVEAKAVLNLWTGDIQALAYNITLKGTNDAVLSDGWYLPAAAAYTVDPQDTACTNNTTAKTYCSAAQRARIIGGEACQWGEGVDATNIFLSVWPDLTMVAERLWSPKKPQGGLDLLDGRQVRLRLHKCRLRSRGVAVAPSSMLYAPDASHASFATWRRWQWCGADAGSVALPIEPMETMAEEFAKAEVRFA